MAWPTDDIVTSNLDSSTDSAASARANLYTALIRIKEIIAGRNTASGVCPLDAGSKVPVANIPALPYLPSTGGTVSGATTFSAGLTSNGAVGITTGGLGVMGGITVTTGNISITAGSATAIKSSQTGYSSAGLQSQSATGNAGIGLHCSGSSAIYLEHARGSRTLTVKDGNGAVANISADIVSASSNVGFSGGLYGEGAAAEHILKLHPSNDSYFYGQAAGTGFYSVTYGQYLIFSSGFTYLPRVYNNTTLTTANMVVASDGNLYRSTSLREFKTDIAPIAESSALDLITPVQFRSLLPADGDRRYFGFIADDVATAVPEAATWDTEGNPEGINDRALIALLWNEVQSLRRRLSALEAAQ
jgi:hypothetical protein